MPAALAVAAAAPWGLLGRPRSSRGTPFTPAFRLVGPAPTKLSQTAGGAGHIVDMRRSGLLYSGRLAVPLPYGRATRLRAADASGGEVRRSPARRRCPPALDPCPSSHTTDEFEGHLAVFHRQPPSAGVSPPACKATATALPRPRGGAV